MRQFNTSGPNIAQEHYTLFRKKLLRKGKELVNDKRYFTIWAPRQTGKSTYFRQLAVELEKQGYKVAHINFESYRNSPEKTFIKNLHKTFKNNPELNINDVETFFHDVVEDDFYEVVRDELGLSQRNQAKIFCFSIIFSKPT